MEYFPALSKKSLKTTKCFKNKLRRSVRIHCKYICFSLYNNIKVENVRCLDVLKNIEKIIPYHDAPTLFSGWSL